uniref:Nucleoporin_C domain-containing protein n=1 Tax=Rhabditophanes sp. KR3021 TaxID=114890 RepID=A0AC35TLM8_9BILA
MDKFQLYFDSISKYPTLVEELLCSVSDNDEIVMGYNNEDERFGSKDGEETMNGMIVGDICITNAYKLHAPSTGLKLSDKHISFSLNEGNGSVAIICVTPEGNVRFWSSIDSKPVNFSIGIKDIFVTEVCCLSIDGVDTFVIGASNGTYFSIPIIVEGPLKKIITSKMSVNPLGSDNRRLTRKVTDAIFGESQTTSNLINIHWTQESKKCSEKNLAAIQVFGNCLIGKNVGKNNVLWEFNVSHLVSKAFHKLSLVSFLGNDLSDLHERVAIIDSVICGKHTYLLCGIQPDKGRNGVLYFMLAKIHIKIYRGVPEVCSKFDWITCLNPHSDVMKTLALSNDASSLRLNAFGQKSFLIYNNSVVQHFEIEENGLHSVTAINKSHTKFDERCYGFFTNEEELHCFLQYRGGTKLRLLPSGFEAAFIENRDIDEYLNKILSPNKKRTTLYKTLFSGFVNFCRFSRGDPKSNLLDEFRRSGSEHERAETIFSMVDTILRSLPAPETFVRAISTKRIEVDTELSNDFTIIKGQLEDKISLCKMFCAFIKNQNLDYELSFDNSAKAPVIELVETIECLYVAFAIFFRVCKNESPVYMEIVNLAVENRNEIDGSLSNVTTFFKNIPECSDIFRAAGSYLEKEIGKATSACEKYEIGKDVFILFYDCFEQIRRYRNEEWAITLKGEKHKSWTSRSKFLSIATPIHYAIKEFFEVDEFSSEQIKILKRLFVGITEFILDQQSPKQRWASELIQGTIDIGLLEVGIKLAEKYEDFHTLIKHAITLPQNERKAFLQKYKAKFADKNFDHELFKYYKETKNVDLLLEEKGGDVDNFISSCNDISWIRQVEKGQYKASAKSLKNLSANQTTDWKRSTLLAFAKLAAYCEENPDEAFVDDIRDAEILSKLQEKMFANEKENAGRSLTFEELIVFGIMKKTEHCLWHALLTLASFFKFKDAPVDEFLFSSLKTELWRAICQATNVREPRYNGNYIVSENNTEPMVAVFLDKISKEAIEDVAPVHLLSIIPKIGDLDTHLASLKDNAIFMAYLTNGLEAAERNIGEKV